MHLVLHLVWISDECLDSGHTGPGNYYRVIATKCSPVCINIMVHECL